MANILKRWLAIRKIRCPGDHVVYVYRDPRDAIPIFVEGIQAQAKVSATLAASTTAQLGGKYQEQITGITKLVAQETEKLLTRFLVIYETYSSSPCRHEKWLLEKIDELLFETNRFTKLQVHLDTIVTLSKGRPNSSEILEIFREMTVEVSQSVKNRDAVSAIKQATPLIMEWRRL
jgi:hypothetical protein